jgi:hypothetical protein
LEGSFASCELKRLAFVKLGISYLLRPHHPRRKLFIADGGHECVVDPVSTRRGDPQPAQPASGTITVKRSLASGNFIAHGDDGDWYAATRLSRQVEALVTGDSAVVGANRLLYRVLMATQMWWYRYATVGRPWLHNPTLCHPKALWASPPFSQADHVLDRGWLWGGPYSRLPSMGRGHTVVGRDHPGHENRDENHVRRLPDTGVARTSAETMSADLDRYLTVVLR